MVENEMSSQEVAEYLGITINNLRQIQHRGTLRWKRREWRNVFYDKAEVLAYGAKREARKPR
jgi:predicted site-specific integrase-resolvase